jgi:hypothetical protein
MTASTPPGCTLGQFGVIRTPCGWLGKGHPRDEMEMVIAGIR